jgi:hypothetical protein
MCTGIRENTCLRPSTTPSACMQRARLTQKSQICGRCRKDPAPLAVLTTSGSRLGVPSQPSSPAFPFKGAAAQSLLLRCQAAALRSRHRHGVLRVTAHRKLMTEWQYPTEVTPDGCFAPAVRQARTVRLRSIRALTPVMAPINPPATRVHRLMSRDGTTASLAADRGRDGTLD